MDDCEYPVNTIPTETAVFKIKFIHSLRYKCITNIDKWKRDRVTIGRGRGYKGFYVYIQMLKRGLLKFAWKLED